jgi:uncharacterized protein YecT (DUF1311 family)
MNPMHRRLLPLLLLVTAPALPQQPVTSQARFKALDKTMETAEPRQRLAWNAVLVAYSAFRDASASHQPCPPAVRDCVRQQKDAFDAYFLSLAEGRFEPGPPSFTAADLQAADAAMNAAYEQLLGALPEVCKGICLTQDTFRDIQRDWIRYRDSWLTYAALRWPQVTPESWLTLFSRARTVEILEMRPANP